jgi:LDH2 family malate/lactate/ureidoglycolate dehydrogenase
MASVLIDTGYSPGPVVTVPAMKQAIQKAGQVGIGWASIRCGQPSTGKQRSPRAISDQ